jgi:hypothetical protein
LVQNFTEVETSKLYKISLMITSEKLIEQFQEHHCAFLPFRAEGTAVPALLSQHAHAPSSGASRPTPSALCTHTVAAQQSQLT